MIRVRLSHLVVISCLCLGLLAFPAMRLADLVLHGRTDFAIATRVAPDRAIAPHAPVQIDLPRDADPIQLLGYRLQPVARFEVEALWKGCWST